MSSNLLSSYHDKRNFDITAEPKGKAVKSKDKLRFVIQLHEATRTHYDFRLEWNGVMKSWAVTKGPSYNPSDKRLAVRTEDHPIEYNEFEGVIPDKQYGAGPVMIWDKGVWIPDFDPEKMEKKGHISFSIMGSRMQGQWHLIRMHTKEKRENWLLIKGEDDKALDTRKAAAFLKKEDTSVISGRTMADIRKAGNGNTAKKSSKQKSKAQKKAKISAASLVKKYASPELATLVENPPATKDWVHEIKYDGYRLMAVLTDGKVILQTRGGKDWTHKFKPMADSISKLSAENAVLDLEACVIDKNGRTDFSALQTALTDGDMEKIEGWVFDLLYLDGEAYTKTPLLERKAALKKLLKKGGKNLHYSDHFESSKDILEKACKIGAEGLVSKRKDSLYHHRRTKDWLKSKCGLEQEFVIGGFMPAKDNAKAIGSLLLGYYQGKKLHYAGKVGTGFTRAVAVDLYKKLKPLEIGETPFEGKTERGLRSYVFVKPERLAQVSFLEWTADKHIRHGSFKGLREDKLPKAVVKEKPEKPKATSKKTTAKKKQNVSFEGVIITHPDRIVFPGTKITKADIAAYYAQIAPLMLPYMEDRLISLLRCTDGIEGECFFQRNPMKGMGDHIKGKSLTHKGKKHEYLYIGDAVGLIQLVQMGTFEFHAWQSKVNENGKPDQIIFDLDPADDVPFEAVKLAAEDIRRRLKKLKLESFARLSGGKGIHVVVPITPEHTWEKVKDYARDFAEKLAADVPDAYVANMSKKRRTGKIFVDFFRNDFSSTAIVPFSIRARKGASVAWPLSWPELKKIKRASEFAVESITATDMKKAKVETYKFLTKQQRLIM